MTDFVSKAAWPGWETVRVLGRGSFGAVYEIQRNMLGEKEKAALKVITIPQSSSDIDELYGEGYDEESITTTFKEHLRSIVAEYSLMRKLNGCSNVVNCDDVRYVQHDDGIGWDIFIKMELLTPLAKALDREVPEEQVIRIGEDICKALVLCKKHNIIHRDIKPANIFVSDNGDYKLRYFCIAKTVEKTIGGTKIGTYEYMAPEVYHDRPYGNTVDIYSLGVVLYWLLNERRTPFLPLPPALPRNSDKELARKRRFQGEAIPAPVHGSAELKRIVLKACAYEPGERYQNAEEMLRDLEALDEGRRWGKRGPAVPAPSEAETEYLLDEDEPDTVLVAEPEDGTAVISNAEEEGTVLVSDPEEGTVLASEPEPGEAETELLVDEDEPGTVLVPEPEDGTVVISEPEEEGTVLVSEPDPEPGEAETELLTDPDPIWRQPVEQRPKPTGAGPSTAKKGGKKGLVFGVIGGIIALAAILLIVLLPKKGDAVQPAVSEPAASSLSTDAEATAVPTPTVVAAEHVFYNGNAYERYDYSLNWEEARDFAKEIGGHLAVITSAEEEQVIEELIADGAKKQYWLGGYWNPKYGFGWLTGEPFSYSNWDAFEPSNLNNNEKYVQIYRERNPVIGDSKANKWNDASIDNTIIGEPFFTIDNVGFIVEYEIPYIPQNAVCIEEDGVRHYFVVFWINSKNSWDDAERICEAMGGHLATLTSYAQNDAAYQAMQQEPDATSCYFGFSDQTQEGIWSWVTGEPIIMLNWQPGEPNGGTGENYGAFYFGVDAGRWIDADFAEAGNKPIICEWDVK